jgi:hypothetical protein
MKNRVKRLPKKIKFISGNQKQQIPLYIENTIIMKAKKLLVSGLLVIPAMALLTSSTLDNGGIHSTMNAAGTSTSTGAPGEPHTCSQATCHGAGNGNSTTGGLADNAGPGSITITSNPAFSGGNKYVPNTTYHMSITVSETGKAIFGFNAEILDLSAPTYTNTQVDNTIGTLTITDPTHTQIKHGWGTGRSTVCHTLNWKAPASGTANIYTSAVTGNNDNLASAQDNVYTKYLLVLTPATTGIAEHTEDFSFDLYPNPVQDKLTVAFTLPTKQQVIVQLVSLDGRIVKTLENTVISGTYLQTFTTEDVAQGIYLLKVNSNNFNQTKKILIN